MNAARRRCAHCTRGGPFLRTAAAAAAEAAHGGSSQAASLTARAAQWHRRRHSRRETAVLLAQCWCGQHRTLTRGAGGAAAAASAMRVFVCVGVVVVADGNGMLRYWGLQPPGGAQSGPDRSLDPCYLCVLVSGRA